MHRAITWASLFGVGSILGGLILVATGILAIFAGSMSDAPQAGDDSAAMGIKLALAGAVLVGVGIWMLS